MLLLKVARDQVLEAVEEDEVVVAVTPGREGSARLGRKSTEHFLCDQIGMVTYRLGIRCPNAAVPGLFHSAAPDQYVLISMASFTRSNSVITTYEWCQ